MRVAFLGLGAMGSRMAGHLVGRVEQLTVWNRTRSAAAPFDDPQVSVAPTPAAAVADADVVFAMVRDDEASRAVWIGASDSALHAMKPGAVAVECSTLSPAWIGELRFEAERRRIRLVDAPLAGSRPQAEAASLIFLAGGAPADVAGISPLLEVMGSAVHRLGGSGSGMKMKLIVNALFGAQIALVAELIAMGEAIGLDGATLVDVLAQTPVLSPAANAAARAMLAKSDDPAFPIELVVKDFNLVQETRIRASASLPVSDAVAQVFQRAATQGLSDRNITAVSRLYSGAATRPGNQDTRERVDA